MYQLEYLKYKFMDLVEKYPRMMFSVLYGVQFFFISMSILFLFGLFMEIPNETFISTAATSFIYGAGVHIGWRLCQFWEYDE